MKALLWAIYKKRNKIIFLEKDEFVILWTSECVLVQLVKPLGVVQ